MKNNMFDTNCWRSDVAKNNEYVWEGGSELREGVKNYIERKRIKGEKRKKEWEKIERERKTEIRKYLGGKKVHGAHWNLNYVWYFDP